MEFDPEAVAETLTVEDDWLQVMTSEEEAVRVGVEKSESISKVSVAVQAPDWVTVTV